MPQENAPTKKEFTLTLPVSIVFAALVIAGAILLTRSPAAPAADAAAGLPANVKVVMPSKEDHILGNPNADIVLVEYSDFQCPFCSVIYPTLKKIVDESGGKIAWIYRNFPLTSIHPQANPAANAAECIAEQLGNDGFWKFADIVFGDQSKLSASYFAQVAAQLGADPKAYASCVASGKYQSKIDAEANDAMQNGGQGTPYTIVIGHGKQVPFSGALPYAQITSIIAQVK